MYIGYSNCMGGWQPSTFLTVYQSIKPKGASRDTCLLANCEHKFMCIHLLAIASPFLNQTTMQQ